MRPLRALGVEALEDRTQPATFGIPWQSPDVLSLSFAPDGTALAGHTSDLFASLDATTDTDAWQRTILSAFQQWAVHANVNIGVRADSGAAFGAPGLVQRDPRFGDIRIGGNPMASEVLALGTPPDPASSGTWSGDILLNTAYRFDGNPYSLLAVALHEAGHALGLGNSDDPNSVMFSRYDQTRTQLSAQDVVRLQAMYGVRAPDAFEGRLGNDTRGRASAMPRPAGYVGETPLIAFGDITTAGDVDFYRFTLPTDGNNDDRTDRSVTLRLQTTGASLLAPRLTVTDAAGRMLANRVSRSATGDVLQVELTGLTEGGTYFVRVQAAANTPFSVGRYGLSVRFNDTSSVSDQVIDELLGGPFHRLGAAAIDAFFRNSGDVLVSPEEVTDTTATATVLTGTVGFDGTRFEAVGSVTKVEDVDVYRLVAPTAGPVLTATVWTPDTTGFQPRVAVLDAAGRVLPAAVLANGDGTSTVQLTGITAGATYYLRVTLDAAATTDRGNYFVAARFGAVAAGQGSFAAGTLSEANHDDTSVVYVGEAQVFHLVLTAGAGSPGASVRLTITDENGTVVYDVTAGSGESASRSSVLLVPGRYTVRVAVENPSGAPLAYAVRGSVGTNPIGPATIDPTLAPKYVTPPPDGSIVPTYAFPPPAGLPPPTGTPGLVILSDPATYPPGWVPPPDLFEYPWLLLSPNPYYWLSLGS
jgi:Matrixin